MANQNYGKKMDNLSKSLYCMLRAEGIGKDEASFLLKKFRNITPQNETSSTMKSYHGKQEKPLPGWYDDYWKDAQQKIEKSKVDTNERSLDDLLKDFREQI